MRTNDSPEIRAFLDDPSNPAAIRDYLKLKNAAGVARLAASMAPRPKAFDPVALVDAAFALQAEAEARLIRRREAMVGRMNFNTLLALARELGVSDRILAGEDDEILSDPVAGPLLRFLQTAMRGNSAECAALEAARFKEALASADARTTHPRPSLPCDLDAALRYAANAPDVPWPVLERAFKDFLGLHRIKGEAEQHRRYHTDLKEQLDRNTKVLANLKLKATTDPQDLKSQQRLELQLTQLRDSIAEWKTVWFYQEYFVPGSAAPADVGEETARIYEEYWQSPDSVSKEASLVFFATDFHAFWQTHGEAYLRLHVAAEKEKEAVTKRNRQAGAKGAATRERKYWLGHTNAFVSYLTDDKNRRHPAAIQDSVTTFAARHSGLNDPQAIDRLKDFLGTLCNPAARDCDAATIRATLHKCGIKACTEATICECLKLLNIALNRGRENK
ncbi:MAG: hypothetical protein NTW21_37125 [Verrucomicrobia bacterium]|nr:hypothetical protein [Verrucomicrobiota bacterium]